MSLSTPVKSLSIVSQPTHPHFASTTLTSSLHYSTDFYLIEEFFYAACELQEFKWASFFLQTVRAHFPKSVKSMRMLGMFYESQSEIVKAQEIYLDMMENDPSDSQTVKRLVCLFRDMDMLSSAIKVLNKYIEANQEDFEAW